MGHLFGRMQRYVAQVKSDIHREMEMSELSKVKTEFETAARDFRQDVESKLGEAERELRDVEASVDRQLGAARETQAPAAPPPSPAAALPAAPEPAQLELGIDAPAPPAKTDRQGLP
jgi:sec-independent protein translocase protein TatB